MKKRTLVVGVVVVLAAAGVVAATRGGLWPEGAIAQAPRQNAPRVVAVEVATAATKAVPVRIEALGSVTPIASVAVKPRIDSEIVGVHFDDGAMVRQGDVLFTLDSRALEAQIKQVQGVLEGAKANLEQAERNDDCAVTALLLNQPRRDVFRRTYTAKRDAPRVEAPVLRRHRTRKHKNAKQADYENGSRSESCHGAKA